MFRLELYATVRQLVFLDGLSRRQVARRDAKSFAITPPSDVVRQRAMRLSCGQMALDVVGVLYTAAWIERNFSAEPTLLKRCLLRSRRRVG